MSIYIYIYIIKNEMWFIGVIYKSVLISFWSRLGCIGAQHPAPPTPGTRHPPEIADQPDRIGSQILLGISTWKNRQNKNQHKFLFSGRYWKIVVAWVIHTSAYSYTRRGPKPRVFWKDRQHKIVSTQFCIEKFAGPSLASSNSCSTVAKQCGIGNVLQLQNAFIVFYTYIYMYLNR